MPSRSIDRCGIDEPITARDYLIRAHCLDALKRVICFTSPPPMLD